MALGFRSSSYLFLLDEPESRSRELDFLILSCLYEVSLGFLEDEFEELGERGRDLLGEFSSVARLPLMLLRSAPAVFLMTKPLGLSTAFTLSFSTFSFSLFNMSSFELLTGDLVLLLLLVLRDFIRNTEPDESVSAGCELDAVEWS